MAKANKRLKAVSLSFLFILILEFILNRAYPTWTFRTPSLVIGNKVITYFAFFGLIFCTMILVRAPRLLNIFFGIVMFLLFCVASCATIFPVDTTSQPKDKVLLSSYADGRKKIIREFRNARAGAPVYDTVLVKDILIFRRLYK